MPIYFQVFKLYTEMYDQTCFFEYRHIKKAEKILRSVWKSIELFFAKM